MNQEEYSEKLSSLKAVEAALQGFLGEIQSLQVELSEVDNALSEVKISKENDLFRMVSGIMVQANKNSLSEELEKKKKMLELRINALNKQRESLDKQSLDLRKEISEYIQKVRKN